MKSNDERIKTLENFNIIGRKKRPVAAVLLLLLTVAFVVLGIVRSEEHTSELQSQR